MEVPPISPLRPSSVYCLDGQSPRARSRKTSSTKNCDRLKEFIEFWKNERKNWTPPSEFVTNVNDVFSLRKVRDLEQNAVDGLQTLFQGQVDYRLQTVDIPTEPTMYIVWCKWPGRTEWIVEEGRSESVAMTNVSVKALKIVLGYRFEKYCEILASKNYTGKTEEELEKIFRSEVLEEGRFCLYQPAAACVTNSQSKSKEHSKDCSATRYFDEGPQNWTEKRWRKLSKHKMEDALFQFWSQTSHGQKFPWTMNLFWVRYPTGVEATAAFMLLFSDGRKINKPGVSWHDLETRGSRSPIFRVKLMWTDQNEKMHHVKGSGPSLILARNDAAKAAMKKIFGKTDLKILERAHSSVVYSHIKRNGINLYKLWDKLLEAKKSECSNMKKGANQTGSNQAEQNLLSEHAQNASVPAAQTNTPEFVVGWNYLPTSAPQINSNFRSNVGAYMASLSCGPVNPSLPAPFQVSSSGRSRWIPIPSRPQQPPWTVPSANSRDVLRTPAPEARLAVGATKAPTPAQPEPRTLLPSSTLSNSSLPAAQASIFPIIATPTLSASTAPLPIAAPNITPNVSLDTSSNHSTPATQISPTGSSSTPQASVTVPTAPNDNSIELGETGATRLLTDESLNPTPSRSLSVPIRVCSAQSETSTEPDESDASTFLITSDLITCTNQSTPATQISPTASSSPPQASVTVPTAPNDNSIELGETEATKLLTDESPNPTTSRSSSVPSRVFSAQSETPTEPDESDASAVLTPSDLITCINQSTPATQISPTAPSSPPQMSALVLTAQSNTHPGEPAGASLLSDAPNPVLKTSSSITPKNKSVLTIPSSPTAPPPPLETSIPVRRAQNVTSTEPREPDAALLVNDSPNSELKELSSITNTNQRVMATSTSPTAPPSPTPTSGLVVTAKEDTSTQPHELEAAPLANDSSNNALKASSTITLTNQSVLTIPYSPTAPPPLQTSVPVLTAPNVASTEPRKPDAAMLVNDSPNSALKELSSITNTNQRVLATSTSPTAPPSPTPTSGLVVTAKEDTSTQPYELEAAPLANDSSNNALKASSTITLTNQSVLTIPCSPTAPPSPRQTSVPVLSAQSDTFTQPMEPITSPSFTLKDSSITSTHQPTPTHPTAVPPTPQASASLPTAQCDTSTQPGEPNLDEYFSTSDDGSVAVPDWLTEYLKTAHTRSMDQYRYSKEKDDPSQRYEHHFLPFDKIIGCEYPQEASLALDELFEDGREPSPMFATTELVLAEVSVGDKTFQGLGATMEEAKETAAEAALKYLQSQSNAVPDEDIIVID